MAEPKTVAHYRERLSAMHARLAETVKDEREGAVDAAVPADDGILHTHNADMDVEGVDAAVARVRSLRDELQQTDGALAALKDRPGDEEVPEAEATRLDLLLEAQSFAEKLDAMRK